MCSRKCRWAPLPCARVSDVFDLTPGTVMTRTARAKRWGGSTQAGIEPSTTSPNVFLYSDPTAGDKYGYTFDGWTPDGSLFLYTGEGSRGDQRLRQRNLSILRHREQGRALRLFVAAGGRQVGGKPHSYVGEFEVDRDQPFIRVDGPDEVGETRSLLVFRLVPVGAVDRREDDRSRGDVAVGGPSVELVPLEQSNTPASERKATAGGTAERREAELVAEYSAHLKAEGHEVVRHRMRPDGAVAALYTDLYDVTAHELYEAKGSIARMSIRLAVGQLLDYRRHLERPGVRLTVLVPDRPSADLLAFLGSVDVCCVYRCGPGRYTRVDSPAAG